MRKLFTVRGFNADGRAIGLGLATALAKQRARATREVEEYLRRNTTEQRVTTTSV